MTDGTNGNATMTSEGEETSLRVLAIPAKKPTAAGSAFLADLENLTPEEVDTRRLRLFDALGRDVFQMADHLGQNPLETLNDVMQALKGRPIPRLKNLNRASLRIQYVPSQHLQKFAGEILTTTEQIHDLLKLKISQGRLEDTSPVIMVQMLSKLLERIIQIRGVVMKSRDEDSDADDMIDTDHYDLMTEKMRKLNKNLEARAE